MNTILIKKIFKEINFVSSKKLGQNFLNNEEIIYSIFKKFDIKKNDLILEIGPGLGSITNFIYKNCKELILIEKDYKLFKFLKLKYKDISNIKIFNIDILLFDFSLLKNMKFRVIGNLPFNIAVKILNKFLIEKNKVLDLQLSFSKEVAEKIIAKPKTKLYSFISVFFQSFFKIEKICYIDQKNFIPKPKVITLFLKFSFLKTESPFKDEDFYNFVFLCFKSKRKTLLNNLKKKIDFNKKEIYDFFKKKDFTNLVRAEWFELKDFVELYNLLKK